jgi:hypothetical protein
MRNPVKLTKTENGYTATFFKLSLGREYTYSIVKCHGKGYQLDELYYETLTEIKTDILFYSKSA